MSTSTHSFGETPPLLLRLVHESTGIVSIAGNIVRKVLRSGNLGIVDKVGFMGKIVKQCEKELIFWKLQGTNDLQTKADRAAQVYITQELHKKFPLASIIGEEGDVMESLEDLISPVGTPIEGRDLPSAEILSKTVPIELSSIQESDVSFSFKDAHN